MNKSAIAKSFQSIVMALLLVVSVTDCSSTRTRASTGQYIDDSTITAKVKSKLLADRDVRGLAIVVETYKGVVQLSGFANNQTEIDQAELLAKQTEGVKAVQNSIRLK